MGVGPLSNKRKRWTRCVVVNDRTVSTKKVQWAGPVVLGGVAEGWSACLCQIRLGRKEKGRHAHDSEDLVLLNERTCPIGII